MKSPRIVQRALWLAASFVVLLGPSLASAEGLSIAISPRFWTAGDVTGAGNAPLVPMAGGSISLGLSDTPYSISASYMTGSGGSGTVNSQNPLWNYVGGKMTNGKYTLMEFALMMRVAPALQVFAGVTSSKWSNDVDFNGVQPNERMSEDYSMPKLGLVFDTPISENNKHHVFSSFSLASGKKHQFYTGLNNGRPSDASSPASAIDTHIGYQYAFNGATAINVRYRYLAAGGGVTALNRNISGFELGATFLF